MKNILYLVVFNFFCYCASAQPCPPNNGNGNQNPGTPDGGNKGKTEVIASHDPNEIIGPVGVGIKKWVSVHDRLPYTILFQNNEFATAPAKIVKVIFPIDPKEDASTFQLENFGFNNLTFSMPANTNSYYQRLDVRDSLGMYVDITAGVDAVTNQVFWIFESVDPVTLLPPADPLKGFLLRPDSTKPDAGHGFVNFSIKPKTIDVTGDTTSAFASIVFDTNDTIPTNRAKNTIDALPPTSHLNPTVQIINGAQSLNSNTVQITWTGNDDPGGSGVANYSLYVSINGRPYTLYRSGLSANFLPFTVLRDTTYCFFITAKDSVKNEEALKNICELQVLITTPLPLTWLDFTGRRRGEDGLLTWSVANEINTQSFILERSLDGVQFNAIGNIPSLQSSGNTTYNFTDAGIVNLGVKTIYYRLKQVDNDGRFVYSKVIALHVEGSANDPLISAFPNPFSESVTLKVTPVDAQDKTTSVELFTSQGVLVYRKIIGKQGINTTILNDLPKLANGIYILKTIVNGKPYTTRLVKN